MKRSRGVTPLGLSIFLLAGLAQAQQEPGPDVGERPDGARRTADDADAEEDVRSELRRAREALEEMRARVERLEQEAAERRQREEAAELEALRRAAEEAANAPPTDAERSADLPVGESFTSGASSLQAFNPEISVAIDTGLQLAMEDGDFLGSFGLAEDGEGSGLFLGEVALHFQSYLDPFSLFKAAVAVGMEGVDVEEAYITWTHAAPGLELTFGLFRQQLGVLNRWHLEALDQVDLPLVLEELLGDEGLAQLGLSLAWLIPTHSDRTSHELTLQVTTPNNERLFSGRYFDVPTALLRLRNYFDLTDTTYLQLGVTGMWGMNHQRAEEEVIESDPVPVFDADGAPVMLYDAEGNELGQMTTTPPPTTVQLDELWGNVWVAGADLTISWSPLQRERYRHVTWRSEFYYVSREEREGTARAMGAFSYLDIGINESWIIGVRGDVTQPLEVDAEGVRWGVTGYATWWQSEFVRLRLQYSHVGGAGDEPMTDRLMLQIAFAAGPHKHERY